MKQKKASISIEQMIKALLVISVVAIVTAFVIVPLYQKGTLIEESVTKKQECLLEGEYASLIRQSYENKNYEKGTEYYNEFRLCYPGEELSGISKQIKLFFKLEYAKTLIDYNELTKAKSELYSVINSYQELLVSNSNNFTIASISLNKIDEAYAQILKIESIKKPVDREEISNIKQEYYSILKLYRDNYANQPGNKVPIDLLMIHAGDLFLSMQDYQAAFNFYASAIENYPQENNLTGQGMYAKQAEDRIIELARTLGDNEMQLEAADICHWLSKNFISNNGKTRANNCLNVYYDMLYCKVTEISENKTIFEINSCSDYKIEYFCIKDKCNVGPCSWINKTCIENPPLFPES